jgi:lipoprotein-anchoring transpeptidase ErfK/SrfK
MGKVFGKSAAPVSRMYEVVMYHWLQITSSGSHGIHATSPPYYDRLGKPASHGCIRQHRSDAKILYDMVRIGTPVYVE